MTYHTTLCLCSCVWSSVINRVFYSNFQRNLLMSRQNLLHNTAFLLDNSIYVIIEFFSAAIAYMNILYVFSNDIAVVVLRWGYLCYLLVLSLIKTSSITVFVSRAGDTPRKIFCLKTADARICPSSFPNNHPNIVILHIG